MFHIIETIIFNRFYFYLKINNQNKVKKNIQKTSKNTIYELNKTQKKVMIKINAYFLFSNSN